MATTINDLPENCLATILSFLTPAAVGRTASVSKMWLSAAKSSTCWDRLISNGLPPCFRETPAALAKDERGLRDTLGEGLMLDDGRYHIKMDPATSLITVSVSVAQVFEILWEDRDQDRMRRHDITGAIFDDASHGIVIHWLSTCGKIDLPFKLRSGYYRMSWRVAQDNDGPRRSTSPKRRFLRSQEEPLISQVRDATTGHVEQHDLDDIRRWISTTPTWTRMPAGLLRVGDGGSSGNAALEFANVRVISTLTDISRQRRKRGLYLDAFVLEQISV
ncbi:hypothetical protein CLOM_g21727 [Closterium sp. NIES-68]|nr:hypothetical protein CLOM_g21727 [Closterium sp. NIES-68]